MVDIDNLIGISNSGKYPNLLNSADIEAVKSIVEIYPDLFSTDLDNGCGLIKSESDETKYGFKFQIPTGLNQYQYFDGSVGESKLWPYLQKYKFLYFQNNIMIEEVLSFEPIPIFSATIDAICQIAVDTTGNDSLLKGLLDLFENIDSGYHDYELTSMNISKVNKYLRLGLRKMPTKSVSDDVYKYIGTRSNTKIYQNTQGLSSSIDDILVDDVNNLVEIVVECDELGLKKQLGYALSTIFAKDAPEGTSPHDNIGLYNERHASHKQCVATISTSAKDHTWLSDDWIDEISTWEELPQAVHGATILTADADGVKSEIVYGIS
mgnify:FL=1